METMDELDQTEITYQYRDTGLWFHRNVASGGGCGVRIEDISIEKIYINLPFWNVEHFGDRIIHETALSWNELIRSLCE